MSRVVAAAWEMTGKYAHAREDKKTMYRVQVVIDGTQDKGVFCQTGHAVAFLSYCCNERQTAVSHLHVGVTDAHGRRCRPNFTRKIWPFWSGSEERFLPSVRVAQSSRGVSIHFGLCSRGMCKMFTERILERGIGEIRVIYCLRSARPCPVCLVPSDPQEKGMFKACVQCGGSLAAAAECAVCASDFP